MELGLKTTSTTSLNSSQSISLNQNKEVIELDFIIKPLTTFHRVKSDSVVIMYPFCHTLLKKHYIPLLLHQEIIKSFKHVSVFRQTDDVVFRPIDGLLHGGPGRTAVIGRAVTTR